jgi:hypothetical protein
MGRMVGSKRRRRCLISRCCGLRINPCLGVCFLRFLPSPNSLRNRTRRQQDTLRYDYYRPLRDEILVHNHNPGYDGFQQLKWVDVVVREGLVHRRYSFLSHRFPVSSTTFLPILHSTLTPSYSSPLFSDRCNPPFQAKPV